MTTAFVGRCSSCKQAFKVDQAERERGVVTCPRCGARYRIAAAPAASPLSATAAKLPAIQPTAAAPAGPGMTHALPGARTPGLTFSPGDSVAGRYRIERFLAQGGMGAVYAARDLELGGPVALKTLHAWIAGDPQSLERFKREIQLARRVTHPNVCRIFDFGVHAPDPETRPVTFYTMELVAGETLAEYLRREGAMRPEAARPWVEQMAAALAAAHAVGVIHRDFKSENVFLAEAAGTSSGGVGAGARVVVADFGIARAGLDGESGAGEESVAARLTGTGQVLGTPLVPEPFEVAAQLVEAADLDLVDPARALPSRANEPRALEDLEVLRDRGAAHVKPFGHAAHRLRTATEALEDRAPRGVRQGLDR